MDDNMVRQLLRTYKKGDPQNPQQMNQAREFFAANPEIAEKRAMGLRGSGLDDNSDVLNLLLGEAAGPPAPVPQGQVQVGQPQMQAVVPQQRQAAPAPRVQTQGGQYNPNQNLGPLPARNGGTPQDRVSGYETDPGVSATNGPGGGGIGDWLLAFLSARAAGARGVNGVPGRQTPGSVSDAVDLNGRALPAPNRALPQGNQKYMPSEFEDAARLEGEWMDETLRERNNNLLRSPDPKLENNRSTTVTNSPELNTAGKNRADKYAKDYADVQEENARDKMLMDQQMKQQKSQNETRDLLKAGRRATGRR